MTPWRLVTSMAPTATDPTTRRDPNAPAQLVALPRRTEWSVVQERPAEEADLDVFTRQAGGDEDWIELGPLGALNLVAVARVELSFGSYASPDYRATIHGDDERTLHIHGPAVVTLQDQLLRRTTRHDNTPPPVRSSSSLPDPTVVSPVPAVEDDERLLHRRWLRTFGRRCLRLVIDD